MPIIERGVRPTFDQYSYANVSVWLDELSKVGHGVATTGQLHELMYRMRCMFVLKEEVHSTLTHSIGDENFESPFVIDTLERERVQNPPELRRRRIPKTKHFFARLRAGFLESQEAIESTLSQINQALHVEATIHCPIGGRNALTKTLRIEGVDQVGQRFSRLILFEGNLCYRRRQDLLTTFAALARHALMSRHERILANSFIIDRRGRLIPNARHNNVHNRPMRLQPTEFATRNRPRNYVDNYKSPSATNAPSTFSLVDIDVEKIIASVCDTSEDAKQRRLPDFNMVIGGQMTTDAYECAICFGDFEVGARCTCSSESKATICGECIGGHIKSRLMSNSDSFEIKEWEATAARVRCPCGGSAVISDSVVAMVAPLAMPDYISVRNEYERRKTMDEEADRQSSLKKTAIRKAIETMCKPPDTVEVAQIAKYARDYILTKRCPACHAPYGGYVKCSCLECDCGVHFCGLCQTFSDKDVMAAHRHVLQCEYNPRRGTSYGFTTANPHLETEESLAVKYSIARATCDRLVAYVFQKASSRKIAMDVLFEISQDAIESGIPEAMFSGALSFDGQNCEGP